MTQTNSTPALKVIPLGGLHEIGKNTCVFEINDEIVLLDAGLAFPTDGMHGVNIVLPDMTYLRENRHKIKGMIVTHGHEDHIGGIAFHLKQFEIPVIYGPRLAIALLQDKLEEAGVSDRTELRTVRPRDIVRIGSSFFVEFIRNTHSIADSFTVAIRTPVGVVIHTGDFKIDHTPVDGEFFDFQRLAEYGEQGVHCLISDSTNSEVPGYTASERSVYPNLDRIFGRAQGRLLVTTFASSVHRINMILELAKEHGRVVSVLGRSMLNVIAHALEFERPFSVEQARQILSQAPGVKLVEDWSANYFPMPIEASGKDEVLVGRIRQDISHPAGLELWLCGDQIRKGAALNAVQIAELLVQKDLLKPAIALTR